MTSIITLVQVTAVVTTAVLASLCLFSAMRVQGRQDALSRRGLPPPVVDDSAAPAKLNRDRRFKVRPTCGVQQDSTAGGKYEADFRMRSRWS